jgi:putative superfamily III holin-X
MAATDLRDRSLGELFGRLSEQAGALARLEIQLAKAEMLEKGRLAGRGAAIVAAGAIVALGAFGAVTATLIMALSEGMDGWLAGLIVTLVYVAIAAALILSGRRRIAEATPPVPEQTIDTLKEDLQWAKTRM